MVFQKTTIDNSLKYVSKASSSQNESSPKNPKTKTASLPRKKNKKLIQSDKKFIKSITREGFQLRGKI